MFQIYIYEKKMEKTVDVETTPNPNETPLFILHPIRLQSANNKERLKIELLLNNGIKYGAVYCSVLELEKDLYKLKEYGTGFNRGDITKIRSVIDRCYRQMDTEKDDRPAPDLDTNLVDILMMCIEYMRETNLKARGSEIHIPIEEFKSLIENSDYRLLGITAIKEKLRDEGITKCNTGRTELNVAGASRVIAFRLDELKKAFKSDLEYFNELSEEIEKE